MLYLVDGPRTCADDAAVFGLMDRDRGRLVIAPEPGTTQPGQVYDLVLRGLGRTDGLDAQTGTSPDRRWALAAMGATGVRHLFVLHPDTTPQACGRALAAVAADAGVTAWFLLDDVTSEWTHGLSRARRLSWEAFGREWLGHSHATPSPRQQAPVGPWLKRAPRPVDRAQLTVAFVTGFAAAAAYRPTDGELEPMAARLSELLTAFSDPVCAADVLCGARPPLYGLGWDLVVDHDRLTGDRGDRAIEVGATVSLEPLHTLSDAVRVATTYLLVRWRIRPADVLDLRMRDIAADASAVSLDGAWLPVPEHDRPLLAGLLTLRRVEQAKPNEFFVDAEAFSRSSRTIHGLIRGPLARLGCEHIERELSDRPGPAARWLAERGVGLVWIPRDEREARGPADFNVDAIRDQVVAAARALGGRTSPCRCVTRHDAPVAVEIPSWPRRAERAPLTFDEGIRRNAYRRSSQAGVGVRAI